MSRQIKVIFSLLAVLCVVGSAIMFAQPNRQYRQMYDVATTELLRRGEAWLQRDSGADSALVCFSLAASRYRDDMSSGDKALMAKANIGKWLVYFSHLFDYPKAYESLQTAIEISQEAGINTSKTEFSLGGMLHVIADQSGSADLYRKAVGSYAAAIDNALKAGDDHTVDMAFVNMLVACRSLGDMASVDSVYGRYSTLRNAESLPRRRFARALYASVSGHEGATTSLAEEISRLPEEKEYVRLRFIGYKILAELLLEHNDRNGAETAANQAVRHALEHGLRDGEMEARLLLSEILRRRGDTPGALDQRDRYLRIKEEMIGSKQLHRLDELRFLADLRKADEQLAVAREERRRQTVIIAALSALFVMAVAFMWVIVYKNRRLRHAYNSVYRQFRANLAADDRELKLLRQIADIKENSPDSNGDVASPVTKYGNSSLGDKERERILSRLAEVVADSGLVCQPGCTIGRLAEAVGCNTKYLSQIINDEYSCNFNTFINEIRIKEASRRIKAGGEWDKLTMEGIANSVGFKSRSTFFQFFKQFTGMTPAEFRRRAGEGAD